MNQHVRWARCWWHVFLRLSSLFNRCSTMLRHQFPNKQKTLRKTGLPTYWWKRKTKYVDTKIDIDLWPDILLQISSYLGDISYTICNLFRSRIFKQKNDYFLVCFIPTKLISGDGMILQFRAVVQPLRNMKLFPAPIPPGSQNIPHDANTTQCLWRYIVEQVLVIMLQLRCSCGLYPRVQLTDVTIHVKVYIEK